MRKPCVFIESEIMTATNQTHDVMGESRIERMRKFLSSPLTRKKSSACRVFGCSLDVLAQRNTLDSQYLVPYIVVRICTFIQNNGLATEGLFRISGNSRIMERLKNSFDQSGDAPLETEGDLPSAAGLLKLFLRELPDPLIPEGLYGSLLMAAPVDLPSKYEQIRSILASLPAINYHVLKYLAKFLTSVAAHEEQNRMGPPALGIVFGPNLFRVADDMQGLKEQSATNHIVALFISHYETIFEKVKPSETPLHANNLEPLTISIPDIEEEEPMKPTLINTGCSTREGFIPSKIKQVNLKQQKHEDRSQEHSSPEQYNYLGEKCGHNLLIEDNAGELSPQPPKPKRRELDLEPPTLDPQSIDYSSDRHLHELQRSAERLTPQYKRAPLRSHRNIGELEARSSFEFCKVNQKLEDSLKENQETSDMLLSISQLNPLEEPIPSEHRFSWPILKGLQGDPTLSPFPRHLRKTSSLEAPLSPSAYRSYLSHRAHLDPSLPPSPPVEQDNYIKSMKEEEVMNANTKLLSKKIHGLKKKIRQFEEVFIQDHGFKPSQTDKLTFPEIKKYLFELNKLRKEMKTLKEGGQSPDSFTHNENKPSMEESLKEALQHLCEKRNLSQRPEVVEEMTKDEVCEEKLAIQRTLLRFETIHGRPVSKNERELMRPLYDRYRSVKRLMARLGSSTKSKEAELQPILEHVAMDFTSPDTRSEDSEMGSKSDSWGTPSDFELQEMAEEPIEMNGEDKNKPLSVNFHELSLTELIQCQHQARSEKHRLRRVLREFEEQFQRETGRKVQKEDRLPLEDMYSEYKHVKAHLKLLEALVTKRQPRNYV